MDCFIFPRLSMFTPEETLTCGQCFRWTKQGEVWRGIAAGREAELWISENKLHIAGGGDAEFWRDYFDLDGPYEDYRERIRAAHPFLRQAAAHAPGIRILRQEPWEALATFILSQNNNIPRITGIVERLCIAFGTPCGDGYAFPSAERLAGLSVDDLSPLRAGFRTKYLLDAARRTASGDIDFDLCRFGPLERSREELMKIYGVGRKVADCTLLFGFHRLEAFPVDVWMARALERHLPDGLPSELQDIAGVAQQYIFHYMRAKET